MGDASPMFKRACKLRDVPIYKLESPSRLMRLWSYIPWLGAAIAVRVGKARHVCQALAGIPAAEAQSQQETLQISTSQKHPSTKTRVFFGCLSCFFLCLFVCLFVCLCVYEPTGLLSYTLYIHIYTHKKCVGVSVDVHACKRYTYIYIYIYMYIYILACIHIYM